jgi:acetyl esterase/lipase
MLRFDPHWLGAMDLDPRRDLAGMIGLAGPYDFLPLNDETLEAIFGDGDLAHTQPINFIGANEPRVLLTAGGADRTVSPGNTLRLAARIRDHGGRATDIIYPRVGHLFLVGAFAPPLRFVAPVLRDVQDYIESAAGDLSADQPDRTPATPRPFQSTISDRPASE